MLSGTSLATTTSRILKNYYRNADAIDASAIKVSSGNKLTHPRDNFVDYFRSENIRYSNLQNDHNRRWIGEAASFVQTAVGAGTIVYNAANDLRQIIKQYWEPQATADEKAGMVAAFQGKINEIEAMVNTTTFDGMNVFSDNGGNPFRSATLSAEDPTQTLDITFDAADIIDVTGLRAIDITAGSEAAALAALDPQSTRTGNYLGKAVGYNDVLTSHYNLLSDKITKTAAYDEQINKTDDAEEFLKQSNIMILQQTSIAMVAQGNMFRLAIMDLFKSK